MRTMLFRMSTIIIILTFRLSMLGVSVHQPAAFSLFFDCFCWERARHESFVLTFAYDGEDRILPDRKASQELRNFSERAMSLSRLAS
jgi:hypothetical protein